MYTVDLSRLNTGVYILVSSLVQHVIHSHRSLFWLVRLRDVIILPLAFMRKAGRLWPERPPIEWLRARQ